MMVAANVCERSITKLKTEIKLGIVFFGLRVLPIVNIGYVDNEQ